VDVRNVLLKDRGAALFTTVQQLPALTDFVTYGPGLDEARDLNISDDNGLPRCQELAELHSRSLTRLIMCMLDGPEDGNLLRLVDLPQLRSCQLRGEDPECWPALNIRIDAISFQGAQQLQTLHLQDDQELQLQVGWLQQLTALTALKLIDCGLHSIPADLASAGMTLCVLDISFNNQLQLDDAAVRCLLGCCQLQKLGLHKSGYSFSMSSMANMLRLQREFRELHGRDLNIFLDDESHEQCSEVGFDCIWPPSEL